MPSHQYSYMQGRQNVCCFLQWTMKQPDSSQMIDGKIQNGPILWSMVSAQKQAQPVFSSVKDSLPTGEVLGTLWLLSFFLLLGNGRLPTGLLEKEGTQNLITHINFQKLPTDQYNYSLLTVSSIMKILVLHSVWL